jgi:hypothetical protein
MMVFRAISHKNRQSDIQNIYHLLGGNMKIKFNVCFMFIFFVMQFVLAGTSDKSAQDSQKCKQGQIEKEIKFHVYSDSLGPLSGCCRNVIVAKKLDSVDIILIGSDGQIIDTIITDKSGIAKKRIKTQIDERFSSAYNKNGITITAIAFKNGYREAVLFEANFTEDEENQNIEMTPIIEGERNEPMVRLGSIHHLLISSFVDKYGKIIGKSAHD